MKDVLLVMVSIPVGIACSIFAWWILFHVLAPRVRFAERIAKKPSAIEYGKSRYTIKLENARDRELIDIQITVYLNVLGLSNPNLGITTKVPLEISKTTSPYIAGRDGFFINVYPDRTEAFADPKYGLNVNRSYRLGTLSMEEVFGLGVECSVEAIVTGSDALSGSRKLFRSKPYRLTDIETGTFAGLKLRPLG